MEDGCSEVVHWQKYDHGPFRQRWEDFVREYSRLPMAYPDGTALESIALMASTAISVVLLQEPSYHLKHKNHFACLERSLLSWMKIDIAELLWEGCSIQTRLTKSMEGYGKNLSTFLLKANVPREGQCCHSATCPTW